eukprot:1195293-Prorocentrum_minimum.AAC.3
MPHMPSHDTLEKVGVRGHEELDRLPEELHMLPPTSYTRRHGTQRRYSSSHRVDAPSRPPLDPLDPLNPL